MSWVLVLVLMKGHKLHTFQIRNLTENQCQMAERYSKEKYTRHYFASECIKGKTNDKKAASSSRKH